MVMDGLPFLKGAQDGSDSADRQVRAQEVTEGAVVLLPLTTNPKLVDPFAGTLPV
jgi:hypothetical protein